MNDIQYVLEALKQCKLEDKLIIEDPIRSRNLWHPIWYDDYLYDAPLNQRSSRLGDILTDYMNTPNYIDTINESEFWSIVNSTYNIQTGEIAFGRMESKHIILWAKGKIEYGITCSNFRILEIILNNFQNRKRFVDINGKRFLISDLKDKKYVIHATEVHEDLIPFIRSTCTKFECGRNFYIVITFIPKGQEIKKRVCKYCNFENPVCFDDYSYNNKPICGYCFESIKHCCECGKTIISRLESVYNIENEKILCHECYEKKQKYLIKAYHDTPELEFYEFNGATRRNSQTSSNGFKGFGIELEVGKAGQKHCHSEEVIKCLDEEVYTMRDGSINRCCCLGGDDEDYGGFEIITHPHTEIALYNMNWEKAFKYLLKHGYRSHDIETCGLHMHISREFFKYDHSAIVRMMYFYDNWYPDVCRFARRSLNKATKWANRIDNNSNYTWDGGISSYYDYYDDLNRNEEHSERYRVVNIQNYATVEIRIMRGTLKLSTFLASLDFMITIMKNAMRIHDHEINELDKWLFGLKPETIEYMKQRKCFGYDIEQDYEQVEQNELEENIRIEEDNI